MPKKMIVRSNMIIDSKQEPIDPITIENLEEKEMKLKQLFTYFGCKKQVVSRVWEAWGDDVDSTVEPFAGTAVVTLGGPDNSNIKNMYLNDFDCHIANVFRSVLYDRETLIYHACHPRHELDLHMIHDYLLASRPSLSKQLKLGIMECNPVLAGWWIWGCNNWIGGNFSNIGATIKADALALSNRDLDIFYGGVNDLKGTARIKLTSCNRLTERVGTARIKLSSHNKLTERVGTARIKLSSHNKLTERLQRSERYLYVKQLVTNVYNKLRDAKILYGDFSRVLTDSYTNTSHICGIILDPPYPETNNDTNTYGNKDEKDIFYRAFKWFMENKSNPRYRIVFCCQECNLVGIDIGTTKKEVWSRGSGYKKGKDRHTEVMLFSDACLDVNNENKITL